MHGVGILSRSTHPRLNPFRCLTERLSCFGFLLFDGCMLGRFGEASLVCLAVVILSQGLSISILKALKPWSEVSNDHGSIHIVAKELRGAKIYLDVSSVGATINIMLAASRAKGFTTIENAAKEPEIIDVATLLNAMGAKIIGAGTETIRIEGVDSLHGCRHSIIPDRFKPEPI